MGPVADRMAMPLHSTMLLLYRRGTGYRNLIAIFTFHYASTLSEGRLSGWPECLQIYIPLCFYFINRLGIDWGLIWSIYIPLCFYFIISVILSSVTCSAWFTFHYASTLSAYVSWHTACHNYLHSTMLLLYPKLLHQNIIAFRIYIPLCFYFIAYCIRDPMLHGFIYIPLCFYFISSLLSWYAGKDWFTFHYASTLSRWSYS